MTMTRTSLSIRFMLILATVTGIHGQGTPREATVTIMSDYEDGLSDREFRVDYAGVKGSSSAIIKISSLENPENVNAKFEYTVENDVALPKIFYFKLKDAPVGKYQVEVCLPNGGQCSAKRTALGEIMDDKDKQTLSCIRGKGSEENIFYEFIDKTYTQKFTIPITAGKDFISKEDCDEKLLPDSTTGYSMLNPGSNPAYTQFKDKKVFYAAVWYDSRHLKELFVNFVSPVEPEEMHTHGYCSRKYVFWASAQIVDPLTKVVKRRFRGTIIVTKGLAKKFMMEESSELFPVEFVRYDEEVKTLPAGNYEVSVSFCATNKDVINSSICSQAVHSELTVA